MVGVPLGLLVGPIEGLAVGTVVGGVLGAAVGPFDIYCEMLGKLLGNALG